MIEKLLRKYCPHKEIGWKEIGEEFTRFQLFKSSWLNVYLHKLNAPNWHPECHDHPWGFVAVLLVNGYLERVGYEYHPRPVGSILWRPATFAHNVITPYGTSWSIIFAGPKSRDWGFKPCDHSLVSIPWNEYRDNYEFAGHPKG
jgi:hypothetical protein